MDRRRRIQTLALTAATLCAAGPVAASAVDLTTIGASGASGGAQFFQSNPAGSAGASASVNTRHGIRLTSVPVVSFGGTSYYHFDVGVSAGGVEGLLSLNQLEIRTSSSAELGGLFNGAGTLRYTIAAGDWIDLNAALNHPGEGDMNMLVPVANFAAASPSAFAFVYSSSALEGGHQAGGEQQFSTLMAPIVPLPPSVYGGAALFAAIGLVRAVKRRNT